MKIQKRRAHERVDDEEEDDGDGDVEEPGAPRASRAGPRSFYFFVYFFLAL
jgi:hypothetical protein